jgi:high-affinity K+ transport system ATPase subunit B
LGVIYLKDILKPNMGDRFARLRAMGIRTIMITGDDPLTASAIATESRLPELRKVDAYESACLNKTTWETRAPRMR